jgi:hypothetical protein
MCQRAGYFTEPDRYADNSMVVSFPICVGNLCRRKADVSLREKVDLAAQMQRYWSDNQVSCTADFDPAIEAREISGLLAAYEDRLKAISFLPAQGHKYQQAPYEEISKEGYEKTVKELRPLEGYLPHESELEAHFCEGGMCGI